MTNRKPPDVSFATWVEGQILGAERNGAFDNLPGKGKPLADLDEPQSDMAWVVRKLRSENVDLSIALPPSLRLAKEVELLPDVLAAQRSEADVRTVVEDLNARIRAALRAPQDGPPMRVWPLDVDEVVARWSAARPPSRVVTPPPPPARRRWRFGR